MATKTIKCVVVNDTGRDMGPTLRDGSLNFELGTVTSGDSSPPTAVPATKTLIFTMTGAPSGWVTYKLAEAKVVVGLYWNDRDAGMNHVERGEDWQQDAGASWGMWCNRYDVESRKLASVDAVLADDKGNALTAQQAAQADFVQATYTVRLEDAEPAKGSDVHATPNGAAASAEPGLPDWAKELSLKRKRLLVCAGLLLPQSANPKYFGTEDGNYGQGGIQREMTWWKRPPHDPATSCTSFNPMIYATFFGVVDPNDKTSGFPEEDQWEFGAPGVTQVAVDHKWAKKVCGPQIGWTDSDATPGKLPQPGDTYLLQDADGQTHHVGCIVYVPKDPEDCWVMADGGQSDEGKYQRCELAWGLVVTPQADSAPPPPRPSQPGLQWRPRARYVGGGLERMTKLSPLYGWVDLDKYQDPEPPDDLARYEASLDKQLVGPNGIVTRIEKVRKYFKENADDLVNHTAVHVSYPLKNWGRCRKQG